MFDEHNRKIRDLFINPNNTHQINKEMVEVNGIEPMTSCLQSRRSPN